MNSLSVYREIRAERARQDANWGDQTHSLFVYMTVLAEECGEVARAVHDLRFAGGTRESVREELIQVAAVAVQIVERMDGGRIEWEATQSS
jgi:NTP pyrophosphatase (non-canonical NTP hydrolase)